MPITYPTWEVVDPPRWSYTYNVYPQGWSTTTTGTGSYLVNNWTTSGSSSVTINSGWHLLGYLDGTVEALADEPAAMATDAEIEAALQPMPALNQPNVVPTAEDIARHRDVMTRAEAARRLRERESAERAIARTQAESTALALLCSMLSPDQVASYLDNGYFDIDGSLGTRYRIHKGVSGNVQWLDAQGRVRGHLCAHPSMRDGWLPTQDVNLAQMLALKTDERQWLNKANVHRGERPPLARPRLVAA